MAIKSHVIIQYERKHQPKEEITIGMSGQKIKDIEFFSKSDPFFCIYKYGNIY